MSSNFSSQSETFVAVVIPCFQVRRYIIDVLCNLGPEIHRIYVVDDACPEGTGDFVERMCNDSRVTILRHQKNVGVGAAMLTGYKQAVADGAHIVVKVDGDGQMDTSLITDLLQPVLLGEADYSKGNRFYAIEGLKGMPLSRMIGNALLSFISKVSSGYWNILDPTNGFTAIHADVIQQLPVEQLDEGFFFESDLLYHLNAIRAVVVDVPMPARYLGESSNLRIHKVGFEFLLKHILNAFKRLSYGYFLRNLNIASIELFLGLLLFLGGLRNGINLWLEAAERSQAAPSGSVMLAAVPLILGTQLLLAFFAYDMQNVPSRPIHRGAVKSRSKTLLP